VRRVEVLRNSLEDQLDQLASLRQLACSVVAHSSAQVPHPLVAGHWAPAARKRDRTPTTPTEGYRERWLQKKPRKTPKTWLSELCSICESDAPGLLVCMGPCLRAFHPG
jgi:hypothetical protein